MESMYKEVAPVKPVAPWLGGKNKLAKRLVTMMAEIDHTTYAEPFVGMGGIFFRRTRVPKAEVINDYSRDVSNLFRILNKHYTPFIEMLRYQITSRDEFQRLVAQDADTLTDLERAARFLYLQKTSFGGKVTGQNFGMSPGRPGRFNITTLEPMLQDVHERLSGVVIECLDWADFIKKYDREDVLFYLDPPYFDCEDDYGKDMFARDSFEYMARLLKCIKGKFVMSINDRIKIRELFSEFNFIEVDLHYSIAGKNSKDTRASELIISNV